MKKQLFFIFWVGLFILGLGILKVQAQEAVTPTSVLPITEVLEIKAQDLGVVEPNILPTSRFYFVKNLWRGINLLVTRDPAKRAELRLKYANEKLLETQKLVQKAGAKTEIIEKQLENYQKDLEKAKEQIEKIEDKKEAIAENLREKYLEQGLKQQLVLQKLATQVPIEVYTKIEENRQRHLEKLSEVMAKVAEKQDAIEKIQEKIQTVAATRPMIHTQTVEIFKDLENKAPENLKSKVAELKINAIKNAAQAIKAVPVEGEEELQKIIEKQLKNIANPITAVEIADEVAKIEPTLKPIISEVKIKPLEHLLKERLENLPEEKKESILEKMITPVPPVAPSPARRSVTPPLSSTEHLEILKEVQQKLLEKLPEQAQAPEMLQRVIDRQTERLKEAEKYKEEIRRQQEEKMEKDVGKPISEEEFIPEGYIYTNKEYGFKLHLKPQKFWQGYKVEKRGQGVGNYATERFDFLVPTETQNYPSYPWASVFFIEIYTPEQWENVFPKPEYLDKNKKYVYAYMPTQDLPIDVIKRGGRDLGKIIKAVMETFKLIGSETEIMPILPIKPVETGEEIEILGNFCGKSSYGPCRDDSYCVTTGCSGQICQSRNEEPMATTCEWRDCYDAKKYGLRCGCFEGKCQWKK